MNEEILALLNGKVTENNNQLKTLAEESSNAISDLLKGGLNLEELATNLEAVGDIDQQIEEIESLMTDYIDGSNAEELEAQKKMLINMKKIKEGATHALIILEKLFNQLKAEEGFTELANRVIQILANNYNLPNDPRTLEMLKKFLEEGGDIEQMIAAYTAEQTQKTTEPLSGSLPGIEEEIIVQPTKTLSEMIKEKRQ